MFLFKTCVWTGHDAQGRMLTQYTRGPGIDQEQQKLHVLIDTFAAQATLKQ